MRPVMPCGVYDYQADHPQGRIALHRPNIPQHFKKHPGGTAGYPFVTQRFQDLPALFSQQTDDDFAIRKRRVVIGISRRRVVDGSKNKEGNFLSTDILYNDAVYRGHCIARGCWRSG